MTLFSGVALVTGAASGIGQGVAIAFAQEGCRKIAICDLNLEGLEETAKKIKNTNVAAEEIEVLLIVVDVMDDDQIQDMVRKAVAKWDRVDYCVNAAGVGGGRGRSTSIALKTFDLVTGVNYRGTWLSSRHEIAQMLTQEPLTTHDGRPGNRGSIVNIASTLGFISTTGAPLYCASKAAVMSITKSDAIDYSKDHIRVNCVCPGVTDTPMTKVKPEEEEAFAATIAIAPMNRMGTVQEIADACLFLCSSKASFIQGAALVVDGGYTIN